MFEKQKNLKKNENWPLHGMVYTGCLIMYDIIFSLNNVWLKFILQKMHHFLFEKRLIKFFFYKKMHIYRCLWFEFSLNKFYTNKKMSNFYETIVVSIECTAGWYGDQCNNSCGYCLNGAPCFHVSGSCDHGCQPGYQVPHCTEGT